MCWVFPHVIFKVKTEWVWKRRVMFHKIGLFTVHVHHTRTCLRQFEKRHKYFNRILYINYCFVTESYKLIGGLSPQENTKNEGCWSRDSQGQQKFHFISQKSKIFQSLPTEETTLGGDSGGLTTAPTKRTNKPKLNKKPTKKHGLPRLRKGWCVWAQMHRGSQAERTKTQNLSFDWKQEAVHKKG